MNCSACPLRGRDNRDSVNVSINDLRLVNTYIFGYHTRGKTIVLKDSIIEYQQQKINLLADDYEVMKRYASASDVARQNLERNLNKSKRKTKIIGGVAGTVVSAFIVLLLIK